MTRRELLELVRSEAWYLHVEMFGGTRKLTRRQLEELLMALRAVFQTYFG